MIESGRRWLAGVVVTSLVLLSPGLAPYQALAAETEGGRVPGTIPALSLPAAAALPTSAPSSAEIPALPVSQVVGAEAAAAPAPAAAEAAARAPVSAFESARLEAGALEKAQGGSEQARALGSFFDASEAKPEAAPDAPSAASASFPGRSPSGLVKLDVARLSAVARDPGAADADRRSAVKAIADLSTDASRLALRELGTETGGSASDYEIKRLALRRLAEQGTIVSLPPVSDEHARQILERLAADKPQAAEFDYDRTLEAHGAPASAETGAVLKALADSGVETMITTDRPARGLRPGEAGIVDALATLSPEQRSAVTVGAFRGAETLAFDAAGRPVTLWRASSWSASERQGIVAALRRARPEASAAALSDYDAFLPLPVGTDAAAVAKAGELVRAELERSGIRAVVSARRPVDDSDEPYLYVTRYDKSLGTRFLLGRRERLRDVERLPSWLRPLGRAVSRLALWNDVAPEKTLIVGDQFMGERSGDAAMLKAAPGALAIAVGGSADPRLDGVFVWNKTGHAAAMELARAASAPKGPAMPDMDWKAFTGLMLSRSISIITFVGTTIAYPALATGVIGGAGFGTVLSLGAVVTIGAGLVVGKFAGKLSPRAGMSLNALLRGLFLLDVPLFYAFGFLNFWTLLIGAAANGFVLASIITTEGAYLRQLFGFKNLGTVNAVFQLSAYAIQVIFGLMLGMGHWVDGHSLMIPFVVAAAAHILLVLPLNWFLLPAPKKEAPPASAAAKAAQTAPTAAPRPVFSASPLLEGLRRRLPPLLAAAGAVAFVAFHTAVPLTVALAVWMLLSDKFLSLARQDKAIAGTIGLVGMGAFVFYAVQNFAIPTMAKLLGGADSGLLNGQMLGAMFFGFLLSISSLVKLPQTRVPLIGRVGLQRFLQAGLSGLAGYWMATGLLPALMPAAGALVVAAVVAAAMGAAAGSMALAGRVSDKGWLTLLGLGFGAAAAPALLWGNVPVMLGALLAVGYFWGPAFTTLITYLQQRAPKDQIGPVMGLNSSVLNAGISLGVAALSSLAAFVTPAFPFSLGVIAAAGLAVGAAYFAAARLLPGLSPRLFKTTKEMRH